MSKISEKTERKHGAYKLMRFEYKSGPNFGEFWFVLFKNGQAEKHYNCRNFEGINRDWESITNKTLQP